jgi:hypothetical protein
MHRRGGIAPSVREGSSDYADKQRGRHRNAGNRSGAPLRVVTCRSSDAGLRAHTKQNLLQHWVQGALCPVSLLVVSEQQMTVDELELRDVLQCSVLTQL